MDGGATHVAKRVRVEQQQVSASLCRILVLNVALLVRDTFRVLTPQQGSGQARRLGSGLKGQKIKHQLLQDVPAPNRRQRTRGRFLENDTSRGPVYDCRGCLA